MPLVRFSTDSRQPTLGIRRGEEILPITALGAAPENHDLNDCLANLEQLERDAMGSRTDTASVDSFPDTEVNYHFPLDPGKIIRVEGSYRYHVTDGDHDPFLDPDLLSSMDWPRLWAAPLTSVTDPGDPITLPAYAKDTRPGVELAIVMKSSVKSADETTIMDHVAGAMVFIASGIFDLLPGQWGYKFFDSALVPGPTVTPIGDLDVDGLDLSITINGSIEDTQSTADLRFPVPELIADVSEMMSLQPGDLILTGDPLRVGGSIQEGDELIASIERLGSANARVRREQTEGAIRV